MIDTTETNVHELRAAVRSELYAGRMATGQLETSVVSFGFKNGLPLDADLVFDVRFLPNPHWVDELRPHSGLDVDARDYVLSSPEAIEFLDRIESMLSFLLPYYVWEGSCISRSRSAAPARRPTSFRCPRRRARDVLRKDGYEPAVHHRDITR